jgi:carboxyl-terminal processing protease
VPDIELPYVFNDMLPREKTMPTAIKNDSIDVRLRFAKMPDSAIQQAIKLSKGRMGTNNVLTAITDINNRVGEMYKETKKPLPITFESVYNEVHAMDNLYKEITAKLETENNIVVTDAVGRAEKTGDDAFYKSVSDYKIKTIRQDPYIFESLKVLKDMNNYKSN